MSIGIVAHEIDKYFELVVSCDDEVQNPLLELESGPIGPPRPFIDGWHNSSIDRGACPLGLTTIDNTHRNNKEHNQSYHKEARYIFSRKRWTCEWEPENGFPQYRLRLENEHVVAIKTDIDGMHKDPIDMRRDYEMRWGIWSMMSGIPDTGGVYGDICGGS
ncbi:hypothetical protein Tco_1429615 [Tanacetum coccineum]